MAWSTPRAAAEPVRIADAPLPIACAERIHAHSVAMESCAYGGSLRPDEWPQPNALLSIGVSWSDCAYSASDVNRCVGGYEAIIGPTLVSLI